MTAALLGFLGGIAAWVATTFISQPLARFLTVRSEAASALARYEDLDGYQPDADEPSGEDSAARKKALADAAAELVAFAHANQLMIRLLRAFKFHPQSAGGELRLLSEMEPFGVQNDIPRQKAMQYLRLGRRFGSSRYRV